ncbi:MAG: hypothetical protein IKE69_00920 [Thermoguttaceae bacterium]|nr:hypothetical protein [Thermoguttaceae bacterium]
MFRIRSITLYRGVDEKEYSFSDNAYVYGHNNVGKTALTKVIDFVLGGGDSLAHDGLDNIEGIAAYIENNKTQLWIRRSIQNEYYYKRSEISEYTNISAEKYKDVICELITDNADVKAVKVYQKVFEESPTYRSFSFVNFVDEIGQGDLGSIFTRGKEIRHLVRIRNIMDFFFNYENIEKIFEKSVELEGLEMEWRNYNNREAQYTHSVDRVHKLFTELGLVYSADMSANFESFKTFQDNFSRETEKPTDDLVYLSRASHSLSEELKLYSYLKKQGLVASSRKSRIERLLSTLKSIIVENKEYSEDVKVIVDAIDKIQQDKLILSLADYDASMKKIRERKDVLDSKIALLKSQASEISYERTLKTIALIEDHFKVINSMIDFGRVATLKKQMAVLKRQIKELKNSYNQKSIDSFNNRLTQMYISSSVSNVAYLNDDRKEDGFSLSFDPFSQVLVAKHKEGNAIVSYTPGSMARHNHLQLLVYLCMMEYLHNNFHNFIYLPILIIDSADQPMEDKSFEEIYPSLIDIAKNIGVQTIFISKVKPSTVEETDLIDITGGLNPFHLRCSQ